MIYSLFQLLEFFLILGIYRSLALGFICVLIWGSKTGLQGLPQFSYITVITASTLWVRIREVSNLPKAMQQLSVFKPKLSDSKACALNPEAKWSSRSLVSWIALEIW